jgi:hypothetical protein
MDKGFFSSSKRPDGWGPNQLPMQWVLAFFPGVQPPEREVNHTPPSTVEVKNEWSCTSTPPICLHGVDRENFIFCLYLVLYFAISHFFMQFILKGHSQNKIRYIRT